MKKLLLILGILAILGLLSLVMTTPAVTKAAQVALTTFQGGTGTTSPSGLLYGDSTIRLKTVTIGSGLTFSGGTLTSSGAFPFTPFTSYNGTSTPIGFSGGLFTNGSTTLAQLGTGFVQSINGLLSSASLTSGQVITALGFTPSPFPFTPTTNFGALTNATGTPAWFQNGLQASSTSNFTYSSTTALTATTLFTNLLVANTSAGTVVQSANGTPVSIMGVGNTANALFYGGVNIDGATRLSTSLTGLLKATAGAVTTATAGTDYENPLTFSAPLIRTTNNIAWTGLATTSQPSSSNVLVSNGGAGVYGVSTTSVSCSGNTTCTSFTAIGSSPITISSTGGGTGLSTSSPTANDQVLVYNSAGAGSAYSIGTTSLTVSGPFTIASPIGVLKNGAITYTGLATTSALTQGQLLYNTTGGNGVASVATSTPTVTAPITYSGTLGAFVGGVGGSFGCTNASSGVTGCLTGTDWNTFNNKQATISTTWPIQLSGATLSFGWATTSQPASSNLFVSNGSNGFYGVATTSATINNGLTGTLTTLGSGQTIGLATINAGVLGATLNGTVPTSQATSTLYGVGTPGYVLSFQNGQAQWVATSSIQNITLTTTGSSGAATLVGNTLNIPNYTVGAAYPFFPLTINSTTTSATTSPIYSYGGFYTPNLIAIGTTSPFAKVAIHGNPTDPTLYRTLFAVGSSTASATSTLFQILNTGDVIVKGGTAGTPQFYSIDSITGTKTGLTLAGAKLQFTSRDTLYFEIDDNASGLVNYANIVGNQSGSNKIYAAGAGSATNPTYGFNLGSANTGIYSDVAQTLRFSTNGVHRATLDTTGNLGLGTSTPFGKFAINLNSTDTAYGGNNAFIIASSTASATTTLFSVSNTGSIFTQLGTGCVSATAGVLSASGTCGGTGSGLSTTSPVSAGNLLVYSSAGAGSAFGVSTSTLTVSGPFTYPSISVIGSSGAITYTGLATTSALTQGQLLYNTTGGNGVASVATTTLVAGSGISFGGATPVILGSSPITVSATGGGTYSFFPFTTYATTTTATTSPLYSAGGFFASTTSAIPSLAITQSGTGPAATFMGGNVGIGTSTPGTLLDVRGDVSGGVARFTRTNATTNAAVGVVKIKAESTGGQMANGFGGAFQFYNQDVDGIENSVADIRGLRDTTDDSGALTFSTNYLGSAYEGFRLTRNSWIGIGSTSPFAKLSIHANPTDSLTNTLFAIGSSTASATTTLFKISNTGAITTSITGSTQCLHVDTNGLITGTGSDCGAASGAAYPFTPTTYNGVGVSATSTALWLKATSPFSLIASSTFATYASSTQLSTTATTTLAQTSGKVGIGLTNPRQKLQIVGNLEIGAASAGAKSYRFRTDGGALDLEVAGAAVILSNWSSVDYGGTQQNYLNLLSSSHKAYGYGNWDFRSGNTGVLTGGGNPVFTILGDTSPSNVGVGTTSPGGNFAIHGNSTDTIRQNLFIIGSSTASATTTHFIVKNTGKVFVPTLTTSTAGNALCYLAGGEMVFAGNTTCVTSSEKTKHDISNFGSADELLKLRVVQYVNNEGGDTRYGLIAEEVNKIDPTLVEFAKEDVHLFDGQVVKKGEPIAVDYQRSVVAVLIKFTQDFYYKFERVTTDLIVWNRDQDQSLKRLEEENKLLKARLDALEKRK